MTDGIQGRFSYPGVIDYESFTMTDLSGIAPSIGILRMYPQYGVPDLDGDITLTYDNHEIVIKNCHMDRADFEEGSGGKIVTVRFLDERWKWAFYDITGRYNIKLPNNFINPDHEKTPRELAKLCFEAMGVQDFDVEALPNDARPDIDWDHVRPAEALAQLCDDLGCRIVPQRSTGKWVIVVVGEGADLPANGWPFNDHGQGIDPKEAPDFLTIVTAPISYQVCLELEHAGKDMDQSWRKLKDLTYKLSATEVGYGFSRDPWQQSVISPNRVRQADGSEISPQELAVQTVNRSFRISETPGNAINSTNDNGEPTFFLPGYDDYVTRKQLIVINELVEAYTDAYGREHKRASLMFGEWWGELGENLGNHNPGTRLDYQESNFYRPEERASFSIAADPIDTDRTIITTSKPMLKYRQVTTAAGSEYIFDQASMFLVCTVNVRDPDTWQPTRHEKTIRIGSGNDSDFRLVVIKNDIQPWYITEYDNTGNPTEERNNEDEVDRMCDYYLNSIKRTFETVASESKIYYGLFPVDLDGAIAQVTYRMSKSGFDTIVSRGTEHNYDIPTYEQRRQRDGRHNIAEKQKLITELVERKIRLLGTNNT